MQYFKKLHKGTQVFHPGSSPNAANNGVGDFLKQFVVFLSINSAKNNNIETIGFCSTFQSYLRYLGFNVSTLNAGDGQNTVAKNLNEDDESVIRKATNNNKIVNNESHPHEGGLTQNHHLRFAAHGDNSFSYHSIKSCVHNQYINVKSQGKQSETDKVTTCDYQQYIQDNADNRFEKNSKVLLGTADNEGLTGIRAKTSSKNSLGKLHTEDNPSIAHYYFETDAKGKLNVFLTQHHYDTAPNMIPLLGNLVKEYNKGGMNIGDFNFRLSALSHLAAGFEHMLINDKIEINTEEVLNNGIEWAKGEVLQKQGKNIDLQGHKQQPSNMQNISIAQTIMPQIGHAEPQRTMLSKNNKQQQQMDNNAVVKKSTTRCCTFF